MLWFQHIRSWVDQIATVGCTFATWCKTLWSVCAGLVSPDSLAVLVSRDVFDPTFQQRALRSCCCSPGQAESGSLYLPGSGAEAEVGVGILPALPDPHSLAKHVPLDLRACGQVVPTHQLLTCRRVRFVWAAICLFSSSVG